MLYDHETERERKREHATERERKNAHEKKSERAREDMDNVELAETVNYYLIFSLV